MKELIQYVDKQGRPTGEVEEKLAAHHADTRRHLAFSCYIFNGQGQLLVTKRAASKKVWPNVWTNSVCGHPLPNESFQAAVKRRAKYELGLALVNDIQCIIDDYTYKTPPYNGIVENEFCPVFFAHLTGTLHINESEVAEYKFIDWQEFLKRLQSDNNNEWSWWAKDQAKLLVAQANEAITKFTSKAD